MSECVHEVTTWRDEHGTPMLYGCIRCKVKFVPATESFDKIARLEAECAALKNPWQPIETAPKDGNCIRLADWRYVDGLQEVMFWDDEHNLWEHRDGDARYQFEYFTHWAPLLEKPSAMQAGEKP